MPADGHDQRATTRLKIQPDIRTPCTFHASIGFKQRDGRRRHILGHCHDMIGQRLGAKAHILRKPTGPVHADDAALSIDNQRRLKGKTISGPKARPLLIADRMNAQADLVAKHRVHSVACIGEKRMVPSHAHHLDIG